MENVGDGDTNNNWRTRNSLQGLEKQTGGTRNQRKSRDHSGHNIVEIGKNTEKYPGYLRKLAATQTPVKYDQITLV